MKTILIVLMMLSAVPVMSEEYYLVKKSDVEWLASNNDFEHRAACSRNIDIFVKRVTKTEVICPKCGAAVEKNVNTFNVPESSPTWKWSIDDIRSDIWRYGYLLYKGYIKQDEFGVLNNWWVDREYPSGGK